MDHAARCVSQDVIPSAADQPVAASAAVDVVVVTVAHEPVVPLAASDRFEAWRDVAFARLACGIVRGEVDNDTARALPVPRRPDRRRPARRRQSRR
jgi:hypothetical protein